MASYEQYLQRQDNINIIESCLRLLGDMTRRELCDRLKLSWGCVSELSSLLIHSEVLLEKKSNGGDRGRTPLLLTLNPKKRVLGTDINTMGISCCLCDMYGKVIKEQRFDTDFSDKSGLLKSTTGAVLETLGSDLAECVGIGIAMQGICSDGHLWNFPTEGGSFAVATSELEGLFHGCKLLSFRNVFHALAQNGADMAVRQGVEDGFALPPAERFEELITEKTRGILICNPNNPSGSLYSREEMEMLGDIVRRHGIFLFSDEVYREFVYDGMVFFSAGHLKGVDENVVIFDSMSKRFSECGIRIGAVISKNRPVAEGFLKLAQARLSPPLLGQIVAEASFSAGHAYLDPVAEEYQHRRDVLIEGLQKIPGVRVVKPQGAFYVIASLPVENAEDFCSWCLTDFSDNGETVMMAPASGFYITPGLGPSEVRIAYVLKSDDLRRATELLAKALRQYSRHVPGERTSA